MKQVLAYAIGLFVMATHTTAQTFEFTENKGQWEPQVHFKGELRTGAFFLQQSGYRVLQYHMEDLEKLKAVYTGHAVNNANNAGAAQASIDPQAAAAAKAEPDLILRSHAYDVVFAGANPKAIAEKRKELNGYSNYFIGNDRSKWASEVKSFGEVWYKDVYPGVDVRYYSENGFLKYELVAQPYAAVSSIMLDYVGVESLQLKDGELVVKTSVSEVREQKPYSYQVINGQRRKIDCRYELVGNKVRFKMNGYDKSQPLVIDPTLIFSTFTGSPADNWGYTATYDAAGNMYAGGIVLASGYPVTPGAFQQVFRGGVLTGERTGFDMGIMKFSANGSQRIYATYMGGTGNEQPHSLIVDNANNLVIAGRTIGTDYPRTTPSIIGGGGQWDIVVTKLNATGTALVGSMQIGGTLDDGVNIKHKYSGGGAYAISLQQNYGDDARSEVIIDGSGNIMLASCTRSNNFPTTNGVIQRTLLGEQDALVMRIDPNVSTILTSTLIGGGGDDAAYVIRLGITGNVYIGGGTGSSDFPGDKSGTVGATYGGGQADGFIAELNPQLSTIIKTTFLGTPATDQVYGIGFDRAGFLYLMGTSTGNFVVVNAPFSQTGGKQFICKLQPDLSAYVYSTVFGTNASAPNISPTAFLVDRCENVYVSGWGGRVINPPPGQLPFPTSGTTGLTLTPDAIQTQTDGKDFYFFVLEKDARSQLFGSFFGQIDAPNQNSPDHVDGGTSRFDEAGIIYQGVCANCGGGQFPTTPGVVGPTNPSGACNQAVIKIAFDLSGVRGGIKSSILGTDGDTSACVPVTIQFRDTVAIATRYEWDFGDGQTLVTTTANTSHTYNQVGDYQVMLVSVDSLKCYPRDTSYVNIRIREDIAPVVAAATKLPPCESNTYRFDNLSTAYPGKPFKNNSFTWIFGDNSAPVVTGTGSVTHQFPGAGTYDVRLVLTDTNYCNAPDTFRINLRVSPLVDAQFQTPASGCAPYLAQFTNTSLGGVTFNWSFGDGATSNAVNPTHLYTNPGSYTVKLVAIDSSTCNIIDSTQLTITVSGKPRVDFTFSPNPAEENVITTFTNLSDVVPRYKWLFGDGDSLLTFRRDTTVRHQYNATGTYNACLIAINQFGCADTICKPVPAIINPLLDVVSAFTPNNDGMNDRARVIGYGIAKMTFRIYNRWGQLMYEGNDLKQGGWDGNYNGKAQPMDAYGYTLDAEFVDGQRIRKSGSITLVR